jgi:hypothetical protein
MKFSWVIDADESLLKELGSALTRHFDSRSNKAKLSSPDLQETNTCTPNDRTLIQ